MDKNVKIATGALMLILGIFTIRKFMKRHDYHKLLSSSKNLKAFLKTIQFAEGTFSQPNPYAVVFGYGHTIRNFNDHPSVTGEWRGKTLAAKFCSAVGLSVGCKSTAAGAYQFIKPTWQGIQKAIDQPIKFNKIGQDIAAIYLLDQKGALDQILAGNFESAIYKSNRTWASLPGSPFGQPTRSMAQLKHFYLNVGGIAT